MNRAQHRSYRTAVHGWVMRSFTMLFALWMCVVPQVICSDTVKALCEESGSTPLPLIEEEEVYHALTEPPKEMKPYSSVGMDGALLPLREDRPHRSLHGEVPHLPPWS